MTNERVLPRFNILEQGEHLPRLKPANLCDGNIHREEQERVVSLEIEKTDQVAECRKHAVGNQESALLLLPDFEKQRRGNTGDTAFRPLH